MTLASFFPAVLSLLVAATLPLGYWFIDRVPDEREAGKRWLIISHAILSLILILVLPWWQGALVAGGLILGWFPLLISMSFLATLAPNDVGIAWIALTLGVLSGTRWRLDDRSPWLLTCGIFVGTLIGIALRAYLHV